MKEFFFNMDGGLQLYWYIASGASVIFIIQTIMAFIGVSTDVNGNSPFQIYALRNLVNFFLGFGWTGVALYNVVHSMILLRIIACVIGVAFVAAIFFAMKAVFRKREKHS